MRVWGEGFTPGAVLFGLDELHDGGVALVGVKRRDRAGGARDVRKDVRLPHRRGLYETVEYDRVNLHPHN